MERLCGMYSHSLGKWVGQLHKERNPDSSSVTCNINGESRSTTVEKTRIKKERKRKK
jgi:hypothetical protein